MSNGLSNRLSVRLTLCLLGCFKHARFGFSLFLNFVSVVGKIFPLLTFFGLRLRGAPCHENLYRFFHTSKKKNSFTLLYMTWCATLTRSKKMEKKWEYFFDQWNILRLGTWREECFMYPNVCPSVCPSVSMSVSISH